MTLVKASFWNALAIAVRLSSALILNKALALFLGPSGYAVLGQFQNGLSIINGISSNAIQPGVVKGVAEADGSPERARLVFRTALTLVLLASLGVGLAVALGSTAVSRALFHQGAFGFVFVVLAFSLLPGNLGALLLSLLNGMKAFREYSIANVGATVLSLVTTLALTWRFGLAGALAGFAIGPALGLLTVWLLSRRQLRVVGGLRQLGIDGREAARFGQFVLMGLTTALVAPLSQIAIRRMVVHAYGFNAAGVWDALNKMSTLYLTFFTTTMAIYYLPRIAQTKSWPELAVEMRKIAALAVPGVAFCATVLVLFREQIVSLLFSAQFSRMAELIPWQACGDVAKVASWVVAYVMVGKGRTTLYIVSEVAFSASLVLLTHLFTRRAGFPGVSIAYAVNYLAYGAVLSALLLSTRSRRARIFAEALA